MSNNTGGPAFPGPYANEQGNIEVLWKQQGMTLRDYFAAKAMQGMCAGLKSGDKVEHLPTFAYLMADAMLEERDK